MIRFWSGNFDRVVRFALGDTTLMSLITFVAEALTNFPTVAAISPSSKYLATAMLEPLTLSKARVALELGAGTGAITHALLEQLPPQATLLAFEINPRFFDLPPAEAFPDPRVVLINSSVENSPGIVSSIKEGIEHVDSSVTCVVGIGVHARWANARRYFKASRLFLHQKSVFTQFQYIHGLQCVGGKLCRLNLRPLLNRYF